MQRVGKIFSLKDLVAGTLPSQREIDRLVRELEEQDFFVEKIKEHKVYTYQFEIFCADEERHDFTPPIAEIKDSLVLAYTDAFNYNQETCEKLELLLSKYMPEVEHL